MDKYFLIKKAYKLLLDDRGYSQKKVVDKIKYLGYQINTSSFNKILRDNQVGKEVLNRTLRGIEELMKIELCYFLDKMTEWKEVENCLKSEIVLNQETTKEEVGFLFHSEGRLPVEDKVKFFTSATNQVIEFGTTLNTFSEYLVSRSEREFKQPIRQLLERGVNLQCYLLDPEWNGARLYFNDRSGTLEEGNAGIEKIRNSLRKLKLISLELEEYGYQGKLEIFTYRHIPHNYFLGVDIDNNQKAKMMISNYLYGESRANCPVVEFTRQAEPTLFIRYKSSLKKIMINAKKIDFSK